ncbi:hypothetical protein B0H19DRAFT_1226301 [Mycena capillaripes]|nr:hypothetical protein B0H19DRAFT_1226301 [Mycena capillaripes]
MPPRYLHTAMIPLQSSINDAVRNAIGSSTFSFRSPAVAKEVWTNIQDAPDAVCEELVLVGEHVLRTCFLSLMLKRDSPRPNGFVTVAVPHSLTARHSILSTEVYATLVTQAGFQRRGPTARPAAEAFLIFVAAMHTSLDDYLDVLNWFRETFLPLIRAVEEAYDKHSDLSERNHDSYMWTLDLLAQIKVLQFQWQVWNDSHPSVPASASFQRASISDIHHICTRADVVSVSAYLERFKLCGKRACNIYGRGYCPRHSLRRKYHPRVDPAQVDLVSEAQRNPAPRKAQASRLLNPRSSPKRFLSCPSQL